MRTRLLLLAAVAALAVGAFLWFDRAEGARARCIVLITPDTLRRDHVGVYGPKSGLTPYIDAWAQGAVRFDEGRSPVPLTLPAHVTMLSGLPPGATGVRTNAERLPDRADRGFVLLPETLREQGSLSAAFVSASVLGAPTGLGATFAHYDDGDLRDKGSLHVPERPGAETVARALAHLRSRPRDEAVFLWVHLFDPHAPYGPSGYRGDVAAVDAAIGTLLEGLRAERPDDVCVLLAADHGEALGDLGEPSHALLLGDAVLRVPFLLAGPGLTPGARGDPAELADVAPTLAFAAGIDWPLPDLPGRGRNLWGEPGPARPSIAESLDAHRRYRWAQLVGASDASGSLVDVGEGRFHWFPRAAPGEDQRGPEPPPDGPGTRALADFIAQYKQLSTPAPSEGEAPTYYGRDGGVRPLVDGAENARLPDPYAVVGRAAELAQASQLVMTKHLHTEGILNSARGKLARLARVDPGNPAVAFWRGMTDEALAKLAAKQGDGIRQSQALARAARAFREAYKLGRRDPTTIWKAAGVNAAGDEQAALDLLRTLAPERTHCKILLLEASLLRALGRDDEANEVCARAEAACRAAGAEGLWRGICGAGK